MKNITISRRAKTIVYLIAFIVVFSFGAYVRPSVDLAIELVSAVFGSNQVAYVVPLTEYETQVNDLWQSAPHQAVCKSNAAATVALRLARKYLEEGEKQSALSNYDLPSSEAIKKTSEYGKR